MKYDFENYIDRTGFDALALDMPLGARKIGEGYFGVPINEGYDAIPMWVADMSFKTAPSITKAITERLNHPIFGYFEPREEYFSSIINWHKKRNQNPYITPETIGYENGVLGGVVSAAEVLKGKNNKILVHSPCYIGFIKALSNAGFELVFSPLREDENGVPRMDIQDMEEKIIREEISTAIFCNPHNPTGRAWQKEELKEAYNLFQRYNIGVISDEIWSDLYLDNNHHNPSALVSPYAKENTISLYAPSKTFNLAGLIGSYHIIYNPELKEQMIKISSKNHYNNMNLLSMYALIGAYSEEGEEWLTELKTVLSENAKITAGHIKNNWKGVSFFAPEATYMLYLDCKEWCESNNTSIDELQRKGLEYGVLWQDGRPFMKDNTIRLNLSLPTEKLKEALIRLDNILIK